MTGSCSSRDICPGNVWGMVDILLTAVKWTDADIVDAFKSQTQVVRCCDRIFQRKRNADHCLLCWIPIAYCWFQAGVVSFHFALKNFLPSKAASSISCVGWAESSFLMLPPVFYTEKEMHCSPLFSVFSFVCFVEEGTNTNTGFLLHIYCSLSAVRSHSNIDPPAAIELIPVKSSKCLQYGWYWSDDCVELWRNLCSISQRTGQRRIWRHKFARNIS